MNIGFSESAVHTTSIPLVSDLSNKLLAVIHGNTDCRYTCIKVSDSYFLKPAWRDMPYRNSFVPEIDISVLQTDGGFVLHILGRPAKSTRIFFGFWFGLLLILQIVLLAAYTFGAVDSAVVFTLVPFFVFGYLLCKLGTLFTFQSVVKAVRKELS